MQALLTKPLELGKAVAIAAATIAILGIYCLAYNAVQGRPETVVNAFSWPVVNLLPFFAAFELAKRVRRPGYRFGAICLAVSVSLVLDALLTSSATVEFELVRRIPAIVAVSVALLLVDRFTAIPAKTVVDELPLLPKEIDWISASGNYLVLHGRRQTATIRMPLTRVEQLLAHHSFVRVHRSILVRHSAIARVRPIDVVLYDGTTVPTGARFRDRLHARF